MSCSKVSLRIQGSVVTMHRHNISSQIERSQRSTKILAETTVKGHSWAQGGISMAAGHPACFYTAYSKRTVLIPDILLEAFAAFVRIR